MGRKFHSEDYGGRRSGRGHGIGSVLGVAFKLCSSGPTPSSSTTVLLLVLSPFLTGRMFVRPNILRTVRRTMIRFLIEVLVRRTWFGQSKLYFVLNWLVMRCKLRPELAADAEQTA